MFLVETKTSSAVIYRVMYNSLQDIRKVTALRELALNRKKLKLTIAEVFGR